MAERVMFVQLKTGPDIDRGPAWISVVCFNRSWKTARWHGKTLRRMPGMFDANFYDIDTDEETRCRCHGAPVRPVCTAQGPLSA